MREILFKARKVDSGEWVQGYLFVIWKQAYILRGTTNGIPNMVEVISSTVCQHTGLSDKNGVKIFEGDIIKWKCYNGAYYERPVQYDAEWNHFCVRLSGAESCGVNKHLSNDIEVIGNIHDKEQNNG